MNDLTALIIRKTALKDVEIWLYQQYIEIDAQIREIEQSEQPS